MISEKSKFLSVIFAFSLLQHAFSFLTLDEKKYSILKSRNINNVEIRSSLLTATLDYTISTEAEEAKKDMMELSRSSDRGFSATSADREKAKEIVKILVENNPTPEPASAYYPSNESSSDDSRATLSGKWTLIYTDAPDITSLSSTTPTAQLGKVGQECNPPVIKNVIEWKRPQWASSLPFSGNENSRILQKVCCEGIANPEKPNEVDLKIVGLDLLGRDNSDDGSMDNVDANSFNGPASFLKQLGPIELRGFLKPPFGKFTVLYLDQDMRVIRTSQGFLAVNIREEVEWF